MRGSGGQTGWVPSDDELLQLKAELAACRGDQERLNAVLWRRSITPEKLDSFINRFPGLLQEDAHALFCESALAGQAGDVRRRADWPPPRARPSGMRGTPTSGWITTGPSEAADVPPAAGLVMLAVS